MTSRTGVNISAFKAFQRNWDMSANRSILQTARTLRRRHKIFSPRPGGGGSRVRFLRGPWGGEAQTGRGPRQDMILVADREFGEEVRARFKVGRKQQPPTDRERDIVAAARVQAPSQAPTKP